MWTTARSSWICSSGSRRCDRHGERGRVGEAEPVAGRARYAPRRISRPAHDHAERGSARRCDRYARRHRRLPRRDQPQLSALRRGQCGRARGAGVSGARGARLRRTHPAAQAHPRVRGAGRRLVGCGGRAARAQPADRRGLFPRTARGAGRAGRLGRAVLRRGRHDAGRGTRRAAHARHAHAAPAGRDLQAGFSDLDAGAVSPRGCAHLALPSGHGGHLRRARRRRYAEARPPDVQRL